MFRIRKISNPYLAVNIQAIEQVKRLIDKQFDAIGKEKIDIITDQLIDPLKYRFHAMLFVADNYTENIKGFALLLHMPDFQFYYLDYIAVTPGKTSSGVGGALYQRVREEAQSVNAKGIFLECLPDDPLLSKNPDILAQNKQRLAFYEKYGARPIINTKYETPVKPEDSDPPYLVLDYLGNKEALSSEYVKQVINAILHRKYGDYCPEKYIQEVVESVRDNPIQLRPFKYLKKKKEATAIHQPSKRNITLIINDKQDIHHVKDRGYVEAPVRIKSILKELIPTGIFAEIEAKSYPDHFITAVHDPKYVKYFKTVVEKIADGKSVYPYVFPIRNNTKPPKELSVRAGYYCIDTFTPLNKNAYLAARSGVNCSLTAADSILQGKRAAYVLTRPPGHHAEENVFGGFCYFNNNAIAANYLSKYGKVAILDIDYHHGNGQQQIFYKRADVLTISIHGHPSFAYPYFSGFTNEKGESDGLGFNFNHALPETISPEKHKETLMLAIQSIKKFKADYLVVALGLDTAKGDPTGTWPLRTSDFHSNGNLIGALGLPTLFIQEGGYKTQVLGKNAKAFFSGFYETIV
ncbi:MAG: histone deacetylase family protein [Bacteroidales bacterium]|nr:histone deacetylase family protein [Bacteroidales bacterium]